MAQTKFSGPVVSDNGFEGDVVGNVSATIVTATTLVIGGSTTITAGAATGSVSAQAGYIPVKIGATTKYIALYSSLTP